MPHAAVMSQWRSPYHGEKFAAGLTALGYTASPTPLRSPSPDDVLVLWNRHACMEPIAAKYDAAGAAVLIVENGYFGRPWLKSNWYAVARNQHNGAGVWPAGDAARWESLNVDVQPWRSEGTDIVILAQRGIGAEKVRQPQGWIDSTRKWLAANTQRRVRVREHPGPQNAVPRVSLEQDLSTAWAVVTWASSAGLKALVAGVPVFHGMPQWIGAAAARPFGHDIEDRFVADRAPMLHRLATAMWSMEEIQRGEPFRHLLT